MGVVSATGEPSTLSQRWVHLRVPLAKTLTVVPYSILGLEVPPLRPTYRMWGLVATGLLGCYSDAQQSKPPNKAVRGDGGGNGSESEH